MKNFMILGVVALVLLGGVFLFKKSTKTNQPVTTESVVSSSQPEVTLTPEASASTRPVVSQTEVVLGASGFSPATVIIKAGAKVVWTNKSGGMATVNSDPHPQHTDYAPLNLGRFSDGGTLELVFDKAGTYKYHNHLNASQTGTVIVE